MFTFHEIGRNSDDAWYSSTYMTLSRAESVNCVRSDESGAADRGEMYWSAGVRALIEQAEEEVSAEKQREQRVVLDAVLRCGGQCNVLVFGANYDAKLLAEANAGGQTVFLEDNYKWQQMVRQRVPCMQTFLVYYSTRLSDWPVYQDAENYGRLEMVLPLSVLQTAWDLVIVRGPSGEQTRLGAWDNPGRMQSIYTTALLARLYFEQRGARKRRNEQVTVVLSDAQRMVEKRFAALFLGGASNLFNATGNVNQYHLKKGFDLQLKAPLTL